MRRGLLKDLVNTPTQIVCGWRLYGPDLQRLWALDNETVGVDLLAGHCRVGDIPLHPSLAIAEVLIGWMGDRLERDRVPEGTVQQARTTLTPRVQQRGLVVECTTTLETTSGIYESHDTTRWAPGDI